jgi:RNA polymerase sigma-70 factor (ECF subfamily)
MEALAIDLTDKELVTRIKHGDKPAFERLVQRYEGKVFRIALRFARNDCDAQDIVQLAFLNVWKHIHAFEGRAQVGSWLHQVAMNTSLMFLRARRRQPGLSREDRHGRPAASISAERDPLPTMTGPESPDEHAFAMELHRMASTSVARLPLELRMVFVNRILDGYSTDKTADLLGISEPAVKTRLFRARAQLRREMGHALA